MTRPAAPFTPSLTRLNYTVAEFAQACGVGETEIREQIESGDLVPHYMKPDDGSQRRRTKYISLEEGLRWLRTRPTD